MRHRIVGALVALAIVTLAPTAASASPDATQQTSSRSSSNVIVETYNLDLGADLVPIFSAQDLPGLVAAAAAGYDEVVANNFPERATALAALIAKERPDIVGLQEAALWQTSSAGPYGPFTTTYDYVGLLQGALAARHLPYNAVVENQTFVGQAPVTADLSGWVRYTDRNVILVRAGLPASHLSTANAQEGQYVTRIPLTLPAPLPASAITRGWASVDVTMHGDTFRFVTTHLEAYGRFNGDDLFRNQQANELVATLATSPYPIVLTGDINSRPTGCVPENINTGAYGIIAGSGLQEVWPATHPRSPCTGFTSGQRTLLDPTNSLDHRIDDVFFSPQSFRATRAEIVGEEQRDRSVPTGFWPSDHASTVAKLHTSHGAPCPHGSD